MLAMPYAMLVGALPDKKSGIYMGIFNFFHCAARNCRFPGPELDDGTLAERRPAAGGGAGGAALC